MSTDDIVDDAESRARENARVTLRHLAEFPDTLPEWGAMVRAGMYVIGDDMADRETAAAIYARADEYTS